MKMLLRILFFATLAFRALHADEVIEAAQKKLKRMGYYDGALDGQMGSQTSAAIRRYQLAEKLKITGQLNEQTVKVLGLASTPAPGRQAAAVTRAEIFEDGPYAAKDSGKQSAVLRRVQKKLKFLGLYGGPVGEAPSSALVAAIMAWQKDAGLPPTGRLDKATLRGLDSI